MMNILLDIPRTTGPAPFFHGPCIADDEYPACDITANEVSDEHTACDSCERTEPVPV